MKVSVNDNERRTNVYTYNFVSIHDSLKTMCNSDNGHIFFKLMPKGLLDDGISLVIYPGKL